jgi:hypothetical protein
MNGVEILNEYTVANQCAFRWDVALVVFGVCLVSIIVLAICMGEADMIPFLIFVAILCSGLIGAIVGVIDPLECHQETHYKVTIDDSVSMNEFLDKYEILDQEGKIYTVKERE